MLAGASARGAESLCEGKAPGGAGGSRGAAPPLLSLQCHNRTRGGENNQLASARGKPPAGWGVQGGQRPPCSRCNAMILAEGKAPGRAGFKGQRPLRTVSPPFEQLCLALAPARAPGGAGFKGQRPLRTVSPPFNLCLALIGLASIRNLLPRFGCTFVLAMISSVLSDFSVFFLLRRLMLERGETAWSLQCEPRKARRAKSDDFDVRDQ